MAAAIGTIAELGYAQASLARIAETAGISKGVILYHLLPLALILRRIHNEENALLATLGDRYRAYASHHKRLVPLVW